MGFGVRVNPSSDNVCVARVRSPKGRKRVTVGCHGVIGTAGAPTGGLRHRAHQAGRGAAGSPDAGRPGGCQSGRALSGGSCHHQLQADDGARCPQRSLPVHPARARPAVARGSGTRSSREPAPAIGLQSGAGEQGDQGPLAHVHPGRRLGDGRGPVQPLPIGPEKSRAQAETPPERFRTRSPGADAERGGTRRHIGGSDPSHDRDGMSQEPSTDRAQADVGAVQGKIRLRDGKSGLRAVRVSPSTMLMLEALPRKEDDPWLFAGRKSGTHMSGIDEVWRIVRELAGLHDVRVHDIRPQHRLADACTRRRAADCRPTSHGRDSTPARLMCREETSRWTSIPHAAASTSHQVWDQTREEK